MHLRKAYNSDLMLKYFRDISLEGILIYFLGIQAPIFYGYVSLKYFKVKSELCASRDAFLKRDI